MTSRYRRVIKESNRGHRRARRRPAPLAGSWGLEASYSEAIRAAKYR